MLHQHSTHRNTRKTTWQQAINQKLPELLIGEGCATVSYWESNINIGQSEPDLLSAVAPSTGALIHINRLRLGKELDSSFALLS